MMRHSSQHKTSERECPFCHGIKEFPDRNYTCSQECARGLQKQGAMKSTSPNSSKSTDQNETHEFSNNAWTISLKETRIHTLEELIKFFEVNTEEWEVERFLVNKWELGRKDKQQNMTWANGLVNGYVRDSGKIFVEPLYQVKAWLRRKVIQTSVRDELADMKESAKRTAIVISPTKRLQKSQSGNLLEISIPDLHIGKLAWGRETGWADYDVRIAEKLFDDALATLLSRTVSHSVDRICFVVGNDLLNTNNPEGTTAAGTQVASDSRFHKTFRIAREMSIRAIEHMKKIAPIDVIVVPGNHDQLATWHLGDSLECYYHKCKDVKIENDPTPRKYYRWGDVMLMWSHKAQGGKREDYPLLMATEQPHMFGETRFHEVHTGDLHQVRLEEKHGIRVRILPSLSAADDWHSRHGFVGNVRSAEAYIWNKNEGLIGIATYSIPANGERNNDKKAIPSSGEKSKRR